MEPDTCPPWWPDLLWWLIHHHPPKPPEPPWWEWVKGPMEEILGAMAIYVQAQRSFGGKHEQAVKEIQQAALEQMSGAVKQLARH